MLSRVESRTRAPSAKRYQLGLVVTLGLSGFFLFTIAEKYHGTGVAERPVAVTGALLGLGMIALGVIGCGRWLLR